MIGCMCSSLHLADGLRISVSGWLATEHPSSRLNITPEHSAILDHGTSDIPASLRTYRLLVNDTLLLLSAFPHVAAPYPVVRGLDDRTHARYLCLPIVQAIKSGEMDLVRSLCRIRLFVLHVVPRRSLRYHWSHQGPPRPSVEKGSWRLLKANRKHAN